MTDVPYPTHLSPENERSLTSLVRAIERTSGRQFSLKLVLCNYSQLRNQVMARLRQACSVEVHKLELPAHTLALSGAIEAEFSSDELQRLPVLSIQGLEQVKQPEELWSTANQGRDTFAQRFPFPLILWVTDEVLKTMIRVAPDFYNWASSPIAFRLSAAELAEFLRRQTHQLWEALLNTNGDSLLGLSNNPSADDSSTSMPTVCREEVEAAQRDLEAHGHELEPELRASLKFLVGQDQFVQDEIDAAIDHYQDSLAVWQSRRDAVRTGLVYVHLGRCHWRQAELDRVHDDDHLRAAEQCFRNGLGAFEASDRPDLRARFIGDLGETLRRQRAWNPLQTVVEESLTLHQAGENWMALAHDYGLKAELCLHHFQDYEATQSHAQQALQLLDPIPHQPKDRSAFLLLLAQAQAQLGQVEEAIAHLRTAREQTSPSDNPRLYITILEQLRALYFQQKDYRTAFEFKREKIVAESQYGFRAFIGAGRLRPQRSLKTSSESHDQVSPEISVSGRQQDVDRLCDRIVNPKHKLTLLHGPLGVGKSSILQAGLIPTLQQGWFATRRIIPVLVRIYTDCQWAEKLGEALTTQLQATQNHPVPLLQSAADILQQLRQNHQRNRVTVLIFDQFEEFFFNCKEVSERQSFFAFLSQCLNIPFVNVILSLREDYLHYLLEWERHEAAAIDLIQERGILSREHRYELGNFSITDARQIMQTLTERAQFYLEPALLDRLVQDLATASHDVKPIELQVIGVQLQTQNITTLDAYLALGEDRQKILVQNYLESVIEDCGPENKNTADLILYVLTDENNTRPPKTRSELETDLKALEEDLLKEVNQIDLVLHIFQRSGLVVLIPEIPADRYQLVHDYLVSFIRAKQPIVEKMAAELKAEREKHQQTQAQLRISQLESQLQREVYQSNQSRMQRDIELKKARQNMMAFFLTLIVLILVFFNFKLSSKNTEINDIRIGNEDILKSEIRTRERVKAMLHLDRAEDLLYFDRSSGDRREAAMIEVMKAALIFLELREYPSHEQRLRVLESFNTVYQQLLSQSEHMQMPGQLREYFESLSSQDYNSLNLDKLSHDKLNDELNESIEKWLDATCQLIYTDRRLIKFSAERLGGEDPCQR
ncbi:MAG: tetratricopeptide repeat protein [Elainellaceae cyanobacterium]